MLHILTQSFNRPWITYKSLANLRSVFPKSRIYLWDDASTELDREALRKSSTFFLPLGAHLGIHQLRLHQFKWISPHLDPSDEVYLTDTDVVHDPASPAMLDKMRATGAMPGLFRTEIEDFHRIHLKRKEEGLIFKAFLPGCSMLLKADDIRLLAKFPEVGENWDWNMWQILGKPNCVVPEQSHAIHIGMGGLHAGDQVWRDRGENLTPWLRTWFNENRAEMEQEASKIPV